jgi:mannose-6-phosphate isomerase-like protein (cupin superfamily)
VEILKQAELPWSSIANELVGDDHGVGVCVIFVDAGVGEGPSLHTHPYEEILVVLDGEATLLPAEDGRVARAGDVVIVRPGEPHGFVNSGAGPLRQVDIHVSPSFATEWL